MIARIRLWVFFKSIWNGILGISTEILTALFFVIIGFMVCLLWWGLLR